MSTYTPIATQTLSSSAATVTFTGIPQNYTDLILVLNTSTSANSNLVFRLNNDSTSIYSNTVLNGSGTTASSARNTNTDKGYFDSDAYSTNNFNYNATLHIMNYSKTTAFKTVLSRSNNVATGVTAGVTLYRSTSAISRLDVLTTSGNFQSGSNFTLYGIGSGSPKAFGGDVVLNDGTYWYHAFTSSGIFAPVEELSCDYFIVAGGGAGSTGRFIGGGGAGGLFDFSNQTLSVGNYAVIIGAGGAPTSTTSGSSGSNSSFNSSTAIGGSGGVPEAGTPTTGGSGGGGNGSVPTPIPGGSGTTGQGSAGGSGSGSVRTAGGGGGKGAVGGNGTSTIGGAGGAGTSSFTSWGALTNTGQNVSGTYWFAGGGGGGAYQYFDGVADGGNGGNGGGGKGGKFRNDSGTASYNAIAGTANTGGGGGGGGWHGQGSNSAAGGSGIVIVRYAV